MAHADTKVFTAHEPLLAENVDQEEERSRLNREAFAVVDAGCVISHQSIQVWAESLNTDTALSVPR